MAEDGAREKVLVLCRAIPEESKKYFQVVCVAGITDKSELRRIYPIPFKPFVAGGDIPFHKKQWIRANLYPPSDKRDKRPESRKIDLQSVEVLNKEDDDRIRSITKPLVSLNIDSIQQSGASLGFIKPKILDYDLDIISTEVEDEQLQITEDGVLAPREMIKLKQESIYRFVCRNRSDCSCLNQPHRMEIHDWEVNELYRHVVERTQNHNEIRAKMRQRWFDWIKNERDTYFMMGTHHRWKNWMIVSVLYLRKK